MGEFDAVWAALKPKEQAKVLALLIERVDHDGKASCVEITFRRTSVKALAGMGDWTGEGWQDVLLHNSQTGDLKLWQLIAGSGRTRLNEEIDLELVIPTGWRVVAVADLDANGTPDLVVQQGEAGLVEVWSMQRTEVIDRQQLNENLGTRMPVDPGERDGHLLVQRAPFTPAVRSANFEPAALSIDSNSVSHASTADCGTDHDDQYTGAASRTAGSGNASASSSLAATKSNLQGIANPPLPDTIQYNRRLASGSLLHWVDETTPTKKKITLQARERVFESLATERFYRPTTHARWPDFNSSEPVVRMPVLPAADQHTTTDHAIELAFSRALIVPRHQLIGVS